jgi:DNA helicase-2/ATP-dependent DNA helicase PcrA
VVEKGIGISYRIGKLSTIHSAKGLEWDAVYLIHAADGCLPSDMATGNDEEIEEELRLTYVAMTRARNFLYVLWPLRYYHKSSGNLTDNHSYAQLCRFFAKEVIATMDCYGSDGHPGGNDAHISGLPVARTGDRIAEMWR